MVSNDIKHTTFLANNTVYFSDGAANQYKNKTFF